MTEIQQQSTTVDLSPETIASYALQDSRFPEIELAQVKHRINLIKSWKIGTSTKVLEIGCGQGNCTTVLAETVGPLGHIDAIDPAPKSYGAPFTLGQAQDHISASAIGDRITWHEADPLQFLETATKTWDYGVLCHCIWYFKSPATLKAILEKLSKKVYRIAIAEYALHASEPSCVAHVIAALTRATIEAHRDSTENIQSPLSPSGITAIAHEVPGLMLEYESTVLPDADLSDGRWEVGTVAHPSFLEEVADIKDARVGLLLRSMRDSVLAAVKDAGSVKTSRTMDVWTAVFKTQ